MAKWRVFLAECQDEEMRSANGVRKIGDADGSETRDTAAASAEAFDGSGMTGKPLFRRSVQRGSNSRNSHAAAVVFSTGCEDTEEAWCFQGEMGIPV